MAMQIVLASANAGKQREFTALLLPYGIELLLQAALGIEPVEESGATFADNALLKARHAARAAKLPALADDSGLEVDALGGAPGVRSARFAGLAASDADNNALLLERLAGAALPERTARYRCVLALVRSADDPAPLLAEGLWEGLIGLAPAGHGGFGYDPLFLPAGMTGTAAELPIEVKNRLSHRALALAQLVAKVAAGLGRSP
jgi:XTP/dITP diphosphohydrolase